MIEKIVYISSENRYFATSYAKKEYPSSMTQSHYHSFYEIMYILNGQRKFLIKDKLFTLNKGDAIFVNPYDFHKSIDAKNPYYERILISFRKEFIFEFMDERDINYFFCFDNNMEILHFNEQQQLYIENLLSNLVNEFVYKPIGNNLVVKAILLQFLIYTSRIGITLLNDYKYHYLNDTHRKISEVIRYIESNYEQELSLNMLADKFYFSPSYLSRIFKKYAHLSLLNYITLIRIKNSHDLLLKSNMSITSISEKVGFHNINHFERNFKLYTGYSPREFKKKYT